MTMSSLPSTEVLYFTILVIMSIFVKRDSWYTYANVFIKPSKILFFSFSLYCQLAKADPPDNLHHLEVPF